MNHYTYEPSPMSRRDDITDDFGAWIIGIIWALPERINQVSAAVRSARRAIRAAVFRFLAWFLGLPIAYTILTPPPPPAPAAPRPRRTKASRDATGPAQP